MRWSAGLFAVLIGLILVVGSGCREIATENTDRNRAPETYLSAAPIDSIAGGGLTRVAHRYRAHWSGADLDGEVVGFYVAVTETTLDAQSGVPVRLPPPRPEAYKFTTVAREPVHVLGARGSWLGSPARALRLRRRQPGPRRSDALPCRTSSRATRTCRSSCSRWPRRRGRSSKPTGRAASGRSSSHAPSPTRSTCRCTRPSTRFPPGPPSASHGVATTRISRPSSRATCTS